MTSTTYYYAKDESGDELTIEEPGELCDFCGKLSTITKKGSLVKVTAVDPISEEFGQDSEDFHAHKECLLEAIGEYEHIIKQWKEDLNLFIEEEQSVGEVKKIL